MGKMKYDPADPSGPLVLSCLWPKFNPRACIKLKLCLPLPSQIHANYACRICIKGKGAGDK